MNILFYEDPVTDCHSYMWARPHIYYDLYMYHALSSGGNVVKMLADGRYADYALSGGVGENDFIRFDEDQVCSLSPCPQDNFNSIFQRYCLFKEKGGDCLEDLVFSIRDALRAALGGFSPDIVIAWVPVPFLRHLFPEALILINPAIK